MTLEREKLRKQKSFTNSKYTSSTNLSKHTLTFKKNKTNVPKNIMRNKGNSVNLQQYI